MAAAVFLMLLSACAPPTVGTIKPLKLSEPQQAIVELLGPDQEVLFFSFDSGAECTAMDVWVEIYQKGVLVESRAAGVSQISEQPKRWKGRMGIAMQRTPGYVWNITVKTDDTRSWSGNGEEPSPHYSDSSWTHGPIEGPVVIAPGQERWLYTSVFSSSGTLTAYETGHYEENPDLLAGYDYAHVIKCRFE